MPCPRAKYDDLDHDLIQDVFAAVDVKITNAKLKTLKILVPYGEEVVPSNAGVILFAKEYIRKQLFPMAYVSCARFSGTDKVDFIDRLDIERIMEAVDGVPNFIRRNTRLSSVIHSMVREDIPEYPMVAIREALFNALMHADYSCMNMRIFVSIFDDRLEIRSPGALLPGMTIEDIKAGVSMSRNMVIARIFRLLGWVEQFGTGYKRITDACAKHQYPLPIFKEVGPCVDVVFSSLEIRETKKVNGTQSAPSRH